jgi:hypothetical protein
MRARTLFWSVVLLLASASVAGAIEREASGASSLSAECRRVQLEVQAAVQAGAPYRNHGQMVSTAARLVSAAVTAGRIDDECASCIMNQFGRNVPIADQEPCGTLGMTANLLGPQINACDGAVAGTSTIVDLPNGDTEVTVTFVSGWPNSSFTIYWTCTNIPNGCHDNACGFINVGSVATNASGQGTATFTLAGGNPYPGKYVHLDLVDAGNHIYTSVFGGVPAFMSPTTSLFSQAGDPSQAGLISAKAVGIPSPASFTGTPSAGPQAPVHSWGWVKQYYR